MARISRIKAVLVELLCGGTALVTTASCDPRTGAFDFFRDDDNEFFYEDDYYVDDFFFDGFYDDYDYCDWDCY